MTTLKELLAARQKPAIVAEHPKQELSLKERLAAKVGRNATDALTTATPIPPPIPAIHTAPISTPISTPVVEQPKEKKSLSQILAERRSTDKIIEKEEIAKEVKKLSLAEILAAKRRNQEAAQEEHIYADTSYSNEAEQEKTEENTAVVPLIETASQSADLPAIIDNPRILPEVTQGDEETIVLNARQQAVVDMMLAGKSLVVTGAAGTGKSTVQRRGAEILLQSDRLGVTTFKVAGAGEDGYVSAPSIAFVAFTRRAANNLRRIIHRKPSLRDALAFNIMTIHALLEYSPEFYTEQNDEGEYVEKFRFAPKRTAKNPLTITHLVIEEASQVDLPLFANLLDALPEGVQIIFIGDINQLPPVFGPSILNYALTKLPVIELTEVYRQALHSPILANAHRVLKGEQIVEGANEDGSLRIITGKDPNVITGQAKTSLKLGQLFKSMFQQGYYNPEEDIILSPWNKQELGTAELNRHVAQFLGQARNAEVHHILASFHSVYLAVGDKVMYNKNDGIVTKITRNPKYYGRLPKPSGTNLSRWGFRISATGQREDSGVDDFGIDYTSFDLDSMKDKELEKKAQASHRVWIHMTDTDEELVLEASGDFNPAVFSLGYALTVHKAQGSEWEKVFIVLHKAHAVSLYRELLYTAITRAKKECILLTKPFVLDMAIKNQRIKGATLADKIAYFNDGLNQDEVVNVTK